MGIKCSLLGHRFAESELEKEREEQGSEVLTTIKEIETCQRCGKERIVSENKEVTALETPDETAEETPTEPPTGSTTTEPTPTPDITAAEDDAELIGDDGGDDTDSGTATEESPAETTTETTESVSAANDDGVIIDDAERDPGEWPDEEADEETQQDDETEQVAATDDEATSTGSDTEEWPDEYGTDDASESPAAVEWPQEESDSEEWTPSENLTRGLDDRDVEPAGSATITVPEGKFECPECGFQTDVEESSLRAGDFCPDCHRGALEQRTDE